MCVQSLMILNMAIKKIYRKTETKLGQSFQLSEVRNYLSGKPIVGSQRSRHTEVYAHEFAN